MGVGAGTQLLPAMEDAWRFFRPPLAPTLYICIPLGDPSVYEQEGVPRDVTKLRDYIVQGALELCPFAALNCRAMR